MKEVFTKRRATMFRITRRLAFGNLQKYFSLLPYSAPYSPFCFFNQSKNHDNNNKKDVLFKLASEFKQQGEIRKADTIYKKIMEQDPYCEEAYQRLWDSWATNCSLKVTEKELNDFIAKYQTYIEPHKRALSPQNTDETNASKTNGSLSQPLNLEEYRSRLEEGKKLVVQGQFIKAREIFAAIGAELEHSYKYNSDMAGKLTQLMSEAYTYEGKTFQFGTEEEANVALGKFKKALELNPSYSPAKKEMDAILMRRDIFSEGKFLAPEEDDYLSSFNVPIKKI